MPTISEQVWIYIRKKPYVQEAIEQGIANFSALARKISHETDHASFDAVKAALMRSQVKLMKNRQKQEQEVIRLLNKSTFNIKNKVALIHAREKLYLADPIAMSKTPSGYIYVIAEENAQKLKGNLDIKYGLSIICITSPVDIERISGTAAFLFSSLASKSINIQHIIDCREDTFLVISEHDAPLAFSVLAEKMRL